MSIKTQLKPGSALQGGKYRILSVLGQGGFGITYAAEQVSLGRRVALKEFFMEEYCNRDSTTSQVSIGSEGSRETVECFRAKFVKEAKMIAGLDHRNIIRIYDVFEENGTAYYVMEYLSGGSLLDLQRSEERLPEDEALACIRQAASALEYIHSMKINHLDIKPGNILLDGKGRAVLIDFGLSKRYDIEGNQTSTTPVGISHGYAPLEQYKPGGVGTFSPATDIYSLGATLYRLLTGQTPPDADVINDEGFPSNPGYVSGKVWKAMEAAMQPRRKDRPQSIAEFLKILDGTADVRDDDRTDFDSHCGEDSTCLDDGKAKSTQAGGTRNRKPSPAPKPSWRRWAVPAVACLLMAAGVSFFLRPEPVPTTGTLTVGSEPSGASVYADICDSLTLIGTTPLAVEISRGTHGIVVRKDGYEPYTTDVTIADAAVAVNATLTAKPVEPARPATTRFYVTTTPSGAAVTIDGRSAGKTPIQGSEVARGSHSIRIAKEGYETYTARLSFGDYPVVLNETLKEKPSQTSSASSQASTAQSATPRPTTGTHNGHEWVDLGLSVKWATCNVGASAPSDYGNYYAWGEVRTKSEYYETNCTTWEKAMGDIAGDPAHDAARYNWGGRWRLPTEAECRELVDNCTWTWTEQGGHEGYRVTSRKNGASIFLPAAGWRLGSSLDYAGERGYYWSSSPSESGAQYAYGLSFGSGNLNVGWYYRSGGRSVRPVSE